MKRRGTLWLATAVFALTLAACGDDTGQGKAKNDNGGGDAGNNVSTPDAQNNATNMVTPDAGNNGGGDAAGNNGGGDAGNNNGGGDAGNNNGGGDMGGDDAGGDDMGEPDMTVGVCGNGVREGTEECDDGNQSSDDDCNPDCTFTCGDGVLGANETCDTSIGAGMDGACPTSCDDMNACTTDTLQGSECQAECVHGDITACVDGDSCCPTATCNANTDNDCMATCGNGIVEGTEICDGDCPTTDADCDDGMACTTDTVTGDATMCASMCVNDAITACIDDDGCCPMMCDATEDNDCSASCGNDVVEGSETCDGNCPMSDADCDDSDVCTTDTATGSATNCTAECLNDPIGCDLSGADGCCPTQCDATTDADCTAVCGNGSVEAGEQCDDSNTDDGDGCSSTCQSEATAFRMSDLDLMDPHVYVDVSFFGCTDITNSVPFNLAPSINDMLQDAIQCDGVCGDGSDDDGSLDLSFLAIFRPLDQTDGLMGNMSVAEADCTAPMSSTSCTVDPTVDFVEDTTYANDTNNTCLSPVPGTVRPYSPAVQDADAPCYSSSTINLTVDISGIQIPLTDVQVGSTYVGNPATSLTDGLLRGFLSESAANTILLPDDIDLVGGTPLAMHLPGGDPPDTNDSCMDDGDCTAAGETCESGQCQTVPNCAGHDDKDMNGGVSGWWFYFNFPADAVPFTEL